MNIELTCNTPDEALFANIRENSVGRKWLRQVDAHEGHAVICGGGPSLADHLHTIDWRQSIGQTVFALNGAAKFLNRHGITPDYQVILDAREGNEKLIGNADNYLIASQCHPSLFQKLPQAQLWHHAIDGIDDYLPPYDEDYTLICGGPSVGLSAMNLAYAKGFRFEHLYGYDSSHREGKGHAYVQSNEDPLCKVTLGGKVFTSTLTMARQAERFPEICNDLIDLGCLITVDSEGLIMAVMDEMKGH